MIIYHNPRCGKSRDTLELIRNNGIEPEIRLYLIEPLTQKELKKTLLLLDMKAEALVRKVEKLYKESYKGKKMSDADWVRTLSKNPILIERPIVVKGKKAIIGRPPENVLTLIK